jgi:hypothetical protein
MDFSREELDILVRRRLSHRRPAGGLAIEASEAAKLAGGPYVAPFAKEKEKRTRRSDELLKRWEGLLNTKFPTPWN